MYVITPTVALLCAANDGEIMIILF